MAVTKITASAELENGLGPDGQMRYKKSSLGNMNETYWAANKSTAITKLNAVVTALESVWSKEWSATILTTTERVTA